MSTLELALQNLKNAPAIVMENVPYAFGFAAIDMLQLFIMGKIPAEIMDSPMLSVALKGLTSGFADASRFCYYDGYDKTV
jgi:hypothetical protein